MIFPQKELTSLVLKSNPDFICSYLASSFNELYKEYISCLEITLYKKGDGHISFGTSYTISAEGREPVICSDLIILDCVITDRINTNILDYLYLRRVIESNSSGPLINGCKNIYSNLERKLKISLYLNND